ncbi:hypothetical protein MMU07_04225 [Aquiflexum sp. LQ15W]|uniref:hypothetical protein n=1 Tax=Cognataquiflexum nitidum TaxID=2922272 RepID=UPI001F13A2B5|nr:hypothetical protein [Cognataquiflexum nitidum]MCH6198776.1 hypothetical protein [Cognataquiflexum nitidum]
MKKIILNTILILILQFVFTHSYCKDLIKNEKDTVLIVFNREAHFTKEFQSVNYVFSYVRGGFDDPNMEVGIYSLITTHKTLELSMGQLNQKEKIWDLDLNFNDWATVWSKTAKGSAVYVIFQDELMHKDRFIYGFKVHAYQVNLYLSAIE